MVQISKYLSGRFLLFSLVLLLFVAAFYFHFSYGLTNESTPFGDAVRFFPYMEFVQNSGETIPLWNPYKLMGIPVFAEAERHIWLAKLISINSEYKNILFNSVLVLSVLFLGTSAFWFAIVAGFNKYAALVFASIIVFSQQIGNAFKSGRIESIDFFYGLIFLTTIFFVNLISHGGNKYWNRLLSVVGVGFLLSETGYYTLVYLFPFVFLFSFFYLGEKNIWIKLRKITLELFVVSLIGLAIFSPFLIQVIEHGHNLVSQSPMSTLFNDQPYSYTFLNTFFPFSTQWFDKHNAFGGAFPFVSIVVLPVLAIYFFNKKNISNRFTKLSFLLIAAGTFFLLGYIFPISTIVQLFSETPILRSIRWIIPFSFLYLVGYSLLSAIVIQHLLTPGTTTTYKTHYFFIALLVIVGITLILGLAQYFSGYLGLVNKTDYDYFNFKYRNISVPVFFLILFVGLVFLVVRPKLLVGALFLTLILQILIVIPYYDAPRVKYQNLYTPYKKALNRDKDYFYYHSYRMSRIRVPGVRNIREFSTMFPEDLRRYLSRLYQKKIHVARPHWIKIPGAEQFNQSAIKLVGIKYLRIPKPFNNNVEENWRLVAETAWDGLFVYKNYRSPLMLIKNWEVETDDDDKSLDRALAQEDVFNTVFLDKPPVFSGGKQNYSHGSCDIGSEYININNKTSDYYNITVFSCDNKLLFMPELFNKDFLVTVNDKNVPLLKANGSFRAIAVTKGINKIKIKYQPLNLYYAFIISLFTVLTLMVLGIIGRGKK